MRAQWDVEVFFGPCRRAAVRAFMRGPGRRLLLIDDAGFLSLGDEQAGLTTIARREVGHRSMRVLLREP